jgi:hypothetical protein
MTTVKLISSPGNRRIQVAHSGLKKAITRGFRTGAYISGKELVDDLNKSMNESKSGKKYRVYTGRSGQRLTKSRLHTASSESETPGIISGNFRRSVDFLVRGNKTLEFGSGAKGFAEDYAKALEEGTSKMAARKPIGRTVNKLKSRVRDNLTIQTNKQMKNIGFAVRKV